MSAWPTARSARTCSWGVSEFHTEASVAASTSAAMAAVFDSRSRWATTRRIAADAIHAASSPAARTATKSTMPA